MKKFLFLLLFLPSCEKPSSEKHYCWDCQLNEGSHSSLPGGNWTYSTSQVKYCDKTQVEINKIMADNFHEGNQYFSNMDCSKVQ
jgi:hypothetical protein